MSYYVRVRIMCDAEVPTASGLEQCSQVFDTGRGNMGGMTKTWAGYLATQHGWRIPGRPGRHDPKRAFCPDHAKEEET